MKKFYKIGSAPNLGAGSRKIEKPVKKNPATPPQVPASNEASDNVRIVRDSSVKRHILDIIGDIREVFEKHFDLTWFSVLIDDVPMDRRIVREIRNLTALYFLHPGDERRIEDGIRELELFIFHVRTFLLPVLKDKLGLSFFSSRRKELNEEQYIIRKFLLYTFPHNLNRLESLTIELKENMKLYKKAGSS